MSRVRADRSGIGRIAWREYASGSFSEAVSQHSQGVSAMCPGRPWAASSAFPVILPANLTLITNHEHREAAGRDALGAVAIGLDLHAFAAVV